VNLPPPIPVQRLLEEEKLKFLEIDVRCGAEALERNVISNPRIQKPGLALAGYLPYVKPGRLQILGESEYSYLSTLSPEEASARFRRLASADVPAILSAKGLVPGDDVLRHCDQIGVPFLVTSEQTSETIESVSDFLEETLAPWTQVHGVLVEVFSLGTLIIGDPGIGKSECALELVFRGHRLVADDIVVIRRAHRQGLRGFPHRRLENYLELRGVGIIDVRTHFGMTATTPSAPISLVIRLIKLSQRAKEMEQEWREELMATGLPWSITRDFLGAEVPMYTMAVAPGRDVAIMVETAVRKCLLAERGIQDEHTFLRDVNRRARGVETEQEGEDETGLEETT